MKQLLREAMEALEWGSDYLPKNAESRRMSEAAILRLKAAIDAPEQEPIGYCFNNRDFIGTVIGAKGDWAPHETPLYTKPHQGADLTDEDIVRIAIESKSAEPGRDGYVLPISFARAVLAAQKGKT